MSKSDSLESEGKSQNDIQKIISLNDDIKDMKRRMFYTTLESFLGKSKAEQFDSMMCAITQNYLVQGGVIDCLAKDEEGRDWLDKCQAAGWSQLCKIIFPLKEAQLLEKELQQNTEVPSKGRMGLRI